MLPGTTMDQRSALLRRQAQELRAREEKKGRPEAPVMQ